MGSISFQLGFFLTDFNMKQAFFTGFITIFLLIYSLIEHKANILKRKIKEIAHAVKKIN
jgi:hypothetical protein